MRRDIRGSGFISILFPPAPRTAGIAKGDVTSMDRKWEKLADGHDLIPTMYQPHSFSSLSTGYSLRVDMAVPGRTCTIAPFEKDVKSFLQDYRFDGKNLRLKSKGCV